MSFKIRLFYTHTKGVQYLLNESVGGSQSQFDLLTDLP